MRKKLSYVMTAEGYRNRLEKMSDEELKKEGEEILGIEIDDIEDARDDGWLIKSLIEEHDRALASRGISPDGYIE